MRLISSRRFAPASATRALPVGPGSEGSRSEFDEGSAREVRRVIARGNSPGPGLRAGPPGNQTSRPSYPHAGSLVSASVNRHPDQLGIVRVPVLNSPNQDAHS
jgi:hypothetical protein